MKKEILLISAAILMVSALGGCGYNRLQEMEEGLFKAWSHLEAGLIERAKLIPEIVKAAGPHAGSHKQALTDLVNAGRWAASAALSVEELEIPEAMQNLQNANDAISRAFDRLLEKSAAIPALADDIGWLTLTQRFREKEAQILESIQLYNQEVVRFNAAIRTFPASLTNTLFLELEPKLHYEARFP